MNGVAGGALMCRTHRGRVKKSGLVRCLITGLFENGILRNRERRERILWVTIKERKATISKLYE